MSSSKNVLKDNYNTMLLEDYLKVKIKESGYSHADISKTPTGTRIVLHVTRPGIVIGHKGTGIRELTETLAKDYSLPNPQITVLEIEKPELAPRVMCNRMASHIERGTAFRRATMWTLQQIMGSGAMGVQITISGKLRGDRSAFEKHSAGILPRAGHHAELIVDEDIVHVKTAMGLIGIRIRIAKKERLIPEFKIKEDLKSKKTSEETAKPDADKKTAAKPDEGKETSAKKEEENKTEKYTGAQGSDETDEAFKARTESEHIAIEEEKMKTLETLEEEEAKFK